MYFGALQRFLQVSWFSMVNFLQDSKTLVMLL
jgi:hypothetical protein